MVFSHQNLQPPKYPTTKIFKWGSFACSLKQINTHPPNYPAKRNPPNDFPPPKSSTTEIFSTKVFNHQNSRHQNFPMQGIFQPFDIFWMPTSVMNLSVLWFPSKGFFTPWTGDNVTLNGTGGGSTASGLPPYCNFFVAKYP